MAAGLTIVPDKINDLRARLNDKARRLLKPEQLSPLLWLDAEVDLNEISMECLRQLGRLNPTGPGNPPVHLFVRNLRHHRPLQRMGAEKQHVKMWVTNGAVTREAMWFGAGNESLPVGRYDLAFVPELNVYNGQRAVQLKVLDWQQAS